MAERRAQRAGVRAHLIDRTNMHRSAAHAAALRQASAEGKAGGEPSGLGAASEATDAPAGCRGVFERGSGVRGILVFAIGGSAGVGAAVSGVAAALMAACSARTPALGASSDASATTTARATPAMRSHRGRRVALVREVGLASFCSSMASGRLLASLGMGDVRRRSGMRGDRRRHPVLRRTWRSASQFERPKRVKSGRARVYTPGARLPSRAPTA